MSWTSMHGLNMAQCFEGSGESSKSIINQLMKMLKDEKNKDFLDQIYYALAGVELKLENENQAIDYLKLSVEKKHHQQSSKILFRLKIGRHLFY